MPSGSSKKKSQLKIASIASLLNTPHDDTAAAAAVASSLKDALQELKTLIQQHQRSSNKARVPAAVLPHVGTVLQAVSWLTRGLFQEGRPLLQYDQAWTVYARALSISCQCLDESGNKITWDQLRPALRPCPEDGVTPGGWPTMVGYLQPWQLYCRHRKQGP
jgi:hypothetical protein